MSSGVSSDLSSCETDLESYSKEAVENMSSEDELDVVNKHYIQSEILEKIRSFGTSVTYFGGQMIQCSVGPLVSPTTHAILEEIGQKQPNGVPGTRSFGEFYKKYKETTKKRKVGRTRSFQQEEMFQKSSVFNNMEIEEHKMELETAFGIRSPTGKQGMKNKLGKCYSLDSRLQSYEKTMLNQNTQRTKREKEFTEVKTAPQKETKEKTNLQRYYGNGEYFDYNARIQKHKVDMEFEEFEVFETLSEKLNKIAEEKESLTQDSIPSTVTNTSGISLSAQPEKEIDGRGTAFDQNGKQNNQDFPQEKIKNVVEIKKNSVQEKRNSWEEAILQKRLSVENQLNERNDGSEILPGKRNSTDGSSNSNRSSCTEDIINSFEAEIKRRSVESIERKSSECSSVSTQSIDFGSSINDLKNQDSWSKQAQRSRRNSVDDCGKRKSSDENDNGEDNKCGTWKRFVEKRKYSSTENLTNSLTRNSLENQTGSRRNSVKTLAPLDDGINGKDFCQEAKKRGIEHRRLSLNGEAIPFRKEENGKRSSFGKSNTPRNSITKESEAYPGDEVITKSNHNSLRGSKEHLQGKRGSVESQKNIFENSSNQKEKDSEKNDRDEGKIESSGDQTEYKITIKISQTEDESYKIGNDQFEEIVIHDTEPMDSLEFYLPKAEAGIIDAEKPPEKGDTEKRSFDKEQDESESQKAGSQDQEYKRRFDRNRNYKRPSRWPMETTVVVDMEKNDEAVPKLISHGKSHVKTTRRLF